MDFFSREFVIFISILFFMYWAAPKKIRTIPILIGGYVFYAFAGLNYLSIIGIITLSSYFFGILIEKKREQKNIPVALLLTGILIPLITLFVFKYLNFFINAFSMVSKSEFDTWDIVLPLGLSFYTFQVVGYLIDIYRHDTKAERNFITYAAYIAFFPQLASGPIARTKSILPQFQKEHEFNYNFAVHSLKRFAYGFFVKYVVANSLGAFVDFIYRNTDGYFGGIFFFTSVVYSIQIYFDFYAYTHMSLGLAGLFDIRLDENFNSPYFSQSIRSFWSRWHISLTKWFRDYLYIPLGGNRCSKVRNSFNVLFTFVVSGLWHGADFTFILWGALHGIAQVIENIFGGKRLKDSKGIVGVLRVIGVFLFVTFAWIFFRAPNIETAITIIAKIFTGISNPIEYLRSTVEFFLTYTAKANIINALFFTVIVFVIDYRKLYGKSIDFTQKLKTPVRWAFYIIFMLAIMWYVKVSTASQFIYYKF